MSARLEHGLSIWELIVYNRGHIDQIIRKRLTEKDPPGFSRDIPKLNDEDRRKWILNDEELYLWAREEGVHI